MLVRLIEASRLSLDASNPFNRPLRLSRVMALRICLAVLLLFLSGCAEARPEVFPVKGQVFHQGQPAVGALVILRPEGEDAQNPIFQEFGFPHGAVEADGSFQTTTWGLNDGAPPGKYSICITWPILAPPDPERREPLEISPDRFQGRYNNPTAPIFKFTVEKKPNEIPKCEI